MNFYETVVNVLKRDERFVADDGTFLRNAVYEAAMQMDAPLIRLLLANEDTSKKFFADVDGVKVFDKLGFAWVINNRQFLPDSYTRFKNKIGLVDESGEMITSSGKVELVFPYKDCILEGGQTKEDQKRQEIFYNEALAPDEIDRLLYPKVLVNARRVHSGGADEHITEFKDDDNLIIKGNNLLALASLLKRYEGRVKCIYIDVPYNTGNDSFGYNDRFNHSSWLVFMKNRIKLAHRLLRNDGSIFIQCDDFEDAYLKVLMDELFGRENFRNKITWKRRGGSANPQNRLNNVTDYILWYQKSQNIGYAPVFTLNDEKTQQYIKERFVYTDEDGRKYMKSPLQSPNPRPNLMYKYKGYKVPAKGWSISKEVMEQWDAEGRLCFPDDKSKNINRKIYLDEYKGQPISSLWTDIFVINPMSKEAIDFTGQKPEALIKRIFDMCTHENEIVLDFFVGTGTTAATALKMGRRFIGVEQMDYVENITVDRLKSVIAGDNSGISSDVNWQGGGSFVYCELAKLNQSVVEKIEVAHDDDALLAVWQEMKETGFISYQVKPADIDAAAEDFLTLSMKDKKRFLMELLDKNLLYVNYCDMDDAEYKISETDKAFTRSFYREA
ncbi:MAG: site-specific DNA-methyltransferase [Selenomonadaceae bacterium]|nr:site-specific DNA-methyltransferase [Selenomonadaceae bacterium]